MTFLNPWAAYMVTYGERLCKTRRPSAHEPTRALAMPRFTLLVAALAAFATAAVNGSYGLHYGDGCVRPRLRGGEVACLSFDSAKLESKRKYIHTHTHTRKLARTNLGVACTSEPRHCAASLESASSRWQPCACVCAQRTSLPRHGACTCRTAMACAHQNSVPSSAHTSRHAQDIPADWAAAVKCAQVVTKSWAPRQQQHRRGSKQSSRWMEPKSPTKLRRGRMWSLSSKARSPAKKPCSVRSDVACVGQRASAFHPAAHLPCYLKNCRNLRR